jgi:hypothetical protein
MSLLRQMLDKIDFETVLRNADLPAQRSNRGYPPEQLFINFLVGVWCGANCFEHLEVTRHDRAIGEIGVCPATVLSSVTFRSLTRE